MLGLYEKRKVTYTCCYTSELSSTIHLHHEIEIVWAGHDGIIAVCDGKTYELNRNDLFVAFPNRIHHYQDKKSDQKNVLMIFQPEQFPGFSELLKSKKPYTPVLRNCSKRIRSAISGITEVMNTDLPYLEQVLTGYMTVIMGEIAKELTFSDLNQNDINGLHRLLEFCSYNYTRDITLDLLNKELYMSRFYISRLFNDSLGISMNDYVNTLRVTEAKRLLKDDNIPITEIAQQVGFGTPRTFNRVFLAQTGRTPRDYRKKHLKT